MKAQYGPPQGSPQSEEISTINLVLHTNAGTDNTPPPLSLQAMPVAEAVTLGGGFGGGYVPPTAPPLATDVKVHDRV
jgi:hypothetical protein